MFSSKLIILLKSLDPKEVTAFLRFCKTDLFYVRDHVNELLAILHPLHPDFTEQNAAAEKIHMQLFGTKKMDKQKLRFVFSNATLLLEKFISFQSFQKNEFVQTQLLLNELIIKKQNKFFTQHIKEFSKKYLENKIHN